MKIGMIGVGLMGKGIATNILKDKTYQAAAGRLNLIVGADKPVFNEIYPLLDLFAENIVHAGEVGAGQALKLIHNYVSLGYAAVMAEAAAQADKQGIDAQRFLDVLHVGGGNSAVLERFRPFLTNKDISGLQFSLSNAAKDIGYYIQAHEDSPLSSAIMDLFCRGVDEIGPSESVLHLKDLLAQQTNTRGVKWPIKGGINTKNYPEIEISNR